MHRLTALTTRLLPALALLLAAGAAPAIDEEELLEPEQAFQPSARAEGDEIVVEYRIAPGYYMYRDAFRFRTEDPDYRLGEPRIPPGKIKQDEFFGEVAIHRDRVRITLPLAGERPAGGDRLTLEATSQGCADLGVCYPPLYQSLEVALPPGGEAPAPAAGPPRPSPLDALKSLGGALGLSDDDVLEPDQAFVLEPGYDAAGRPSLRWDIAPGYYLYRDKLAVEALGDTPATLGALEPPAGKLKHDEFFGDMQVFYDGVAVPLPVQGGLRDALQVAVTYQGCAERGICYPPITKTVAFDPQARTAAVVGEGRVAAEPPAPAPAPAGADISPLPGASPAGADAAGRLSEQDRLARFLLDKPLWLSALLFFAVGIGLAFTPCVFPMIPILSGIIVGQGEGITTRKAFTLSLVYVLAMAATYTVVGVLVGLSGESIQAWFQNPWVLGAFAAVFVLLSLSMFGFYELQMPAAVQSRLTQVSNSQQGGTLIGVGIMGFLSALIVGPCVTAPLIAVLIVIAQTGDALLGGVALFALSLGMGAPLLAIGTGAGKLLPRAGAWMEATKAVFGVLLLAVAVWMLERVLPTAVTMALWGALLLVSAIYLGALEPVPQAASGWRRLWKGAGLVLMVYGALMLVGAAAGGRDVLQPLKGVVAAGPGQAASTGSELAFKRVKGVDGLERELAVASAQGRTVMLDFYADWCTSCKEMEKYTFSDPRVQRALADTLVLKTDVTANDAQDRALMKSFGIFGPPAILFFDPAGEERRGWRVVGFLGPAEFSEHVREFVATATGSV